MSRSNTSSSSRITAPSTALICQDADLRGDITMGEGAIVHPKAAILAVGGPIVFGRNCIVEETAVIVNRHKEAMIIGDDNVFMIGCRVESPSIGNSNVFHPRSKASNLVHISHDCHIFPGTVVLPLDPSGTVEETLPAYTVIYGSASSRRLWDGSGQSGERTLREKHADFLREIMPKSHKMRAVGAQ